MPVLPLDHDLRRTMEATFLNLVANDPDVRPYLGGEGPADLTDILQDPANFGFVGKHGGFLLFHCGGGTYDAHSMVLPAGRGEDSARLTRSVMQYMFTRTDCVRLITNVPSNNPAASALAKLCGFTPWSSSTRPWPIGGGSVSMTSYALDLDVWIQKSPECLEAGHEFHAGLSALVSTREEHEDDPAHERAAGASFLMAMAGNGLKAMDTYNRWARMSAYQPIRLLSNHPILMDVGDGIIVEARDGEMHLAYQPAPKEMPCLL